jgi:hypothetical protein
MKLYKKKEENKHKTHINSKTKLHNNKIFTTKYLAVNT